MQGKTKVESCSVINSTENYHLSWNDIAYQVTQKGNNQCILNGVSGYANSGEILAIMGSSGSGKTTLLSVLSNRAYSQSNVTISGSVYLNSIPLKSFSSSHYIRYVLQEDILFATQTVRESFTFAATLKVPRLTQEEIRERVEETIESLGLKKVADNIIGNAIRKGLSGGEKRRVSIGNELIAHPSVIILDEPTSGLDSNNAQLLVNTLKMQANKGKMIIFTIHQPSSKIFSLFDRLILMSEGHFLFQGPKDEAVGHFSQLGYSCPLSVNPPEYFMRLFHVADRHNMTDDEKQDLDKWIAGYNSQKEEIISHEAFNLAKINTTNERNKPSTRIQLKAVLKRAIQNVKRQPMLSAIKIVQGIFLASLVILVYHNNGSDQKSIQNLTGVLFFNTMGFIAMPMQAQVITFPLERPAFINEYREGLYGVLPYILTKLICEFPFQIIFTTIYACVTYFVIPYNTSSASKFFIYYGIALLAQLNGNALGYMVGSFTSDISIGSMLGPLFLMIFAVYAGFFGNLSSFSLAFEWVKYISCFHYTYRVLILNQFTDFDLDGVNPIERLNFDGEIWLYTLLLFLVSIGALLITCLSLKINGEYKKRH